MHIAPEQSNNRLQQHNPHHPANVANRKALARVVGRFPVEAMQPSSVSTKEMHQAHGGMNNHTYFTPHQDSQARRMYRRNASPLTRLGNRVEGVLGLRGVGKEIASSFNPTTKAGLVNVASMFAGGPKDESLGEGALGRMGGKHSFTAYSESLGTALDRGIEHEGPGFGRRGAGIRGLTRRAQGTGRYNRPEGGLADMSRIEALREARGKIGQTNDMIKDYANRTGLANKRSNEQMHMNHAYEQNTGGGLTPYLPHHQGAEPTVGNHDIQPHDYTDRMKLLGLLQKNPESPMLDPAMATPAMRAIWDMLFGSKSFQGPIKPPRP